MWRCNPYYSSSPQHLRVWHPHEEETCVGLHQQAVVKSVGAHESWNHTGGLKYRTQETPLLQKWEEEKKKGARRALGEGGEGQLTASVERKELQETEETTS